MSVKIIEEKYNLIEWERVVYTDSRRPNCRKPLIVWYKKIIAFAFYVEFSDEQQKTPTQTGM